MAGEGKRGFRVRSRCAHGVEYVGSGNLFARAPMRCLGPGRWSNAGCVKGSCDTCVSRAKSATPSVAVQSQASSPCGETPELPRTPQIIYYLVYRYALHAVMHQVHDQDTAIRMNRIRSATVKTCCSCIREPSQANDERCGHRTLARVVSDFRRQHLGLDKFAVYVQQYTQNCFRYANSATKQWPYSSMTEANFSVSFCSSSSDCGYR